MGRNCSPAASGITVTRAGSSSSCAVASRRGRLRRADHRGRAAHRAVEHAVREPGPQVALGPLQRHHVMHRHHRCGPAQDRGAVGRQRVVHPGAGAGQVEREQRLLGQLHRPGRQRRPPQLSPVTAHRAEGLRPARGRAQQRELGAPLGGHLHQRPEQPVGVAADPLRAQVLDVERTGVDAHRERSGHAVTCGPSRTPPRSARPPRAARVVVRQQISVWPQRPSSASISGLRMSQPHFSCQ